MGLFDRFIKKPTPEPKETTKSAGNMQRLDSPLQERFLIAGTKVDDKFNNNTLLTLYETVSQVNSIVNYIASKGSDIPIKHVKYLGNGKTKDLGETELLQSLNNPNKGVSRNSFAEDIILQFLIQGNTPIIKTYTPGFKYPTSYKVYPSHELFVIPQWHIDQYGTPSQAKSVFDNPVVGYKHRLQNGTMRALTIEEVCYIKDKNPRKTGKDYYNGASRLYAATRTIKVLSNLYDTINTILSAKGALGFVRRTTTAGEIDPMQWKQTAEDLEQKLNYEYGTTDGKKAIGTTYGNFDWVRMDSPVNEFLPIELTQQEFAQLCNQLGGMPDVLLNSKGSSTYNNVLELNKAFYENVIKPLLSNIYDSISIDLGISKSNEWIVADYSKIQALNEVPIDKIKYYYDSKMLSKNEALELGGLPQNSDASFNEINKEENGLQKQSGGESDT